MGKAEPEGDAGPCQDRGLEAPVGVYGPILAPFRITGAHCGAQCGGEHPCDFSGAEVQGWLGTPLGTSGPLWGHRGPALSHSGPLSQLLGVSVLFPVGPSPGQGLWVGLCLGLLTLGKGGRSRNSGKKNGIGGHFPLGLPKLLSCFPPHCADDAADGTCPPLTFQWPGDPGVKPP